MKKIISGLILIITLTGCSMVLDGSNESLDQVGFGIKLGTDNGCRDIALTEGDVFFFEFPGGFVSLDESTRFMVESTEISIEDDQQTLRMDTVLFLRRSKQSPGLCGGVIVQDKDNKQSFRSINQTSIAFGEPGGALVRSFSDVLNTDGERSNLDLRANIRYSDPLKSIDILYFDDNNQLVQRVDGFTLNEIDLKTGYIVIEMTRITFDSTLYIERNVYSPNDRRIGEFEVFTFPYFEGDDVVAKLKSIKIYREGL
ncbi:hypothetical protein AOC36_11160 [Erysipelothrix larvae]|uniref:Lipoprotein n=1 Tax=Erysipelothrix larvae TaxID=1514105 RepID=A0A0X8H1Q9_9FIRM|nr:membrane lipoprotein lipid attachment site-containing protein [Erysipelothrix larvae]AMC94509.1 hypothetical protein AOC36_11160 [Erysipelothrix larvae]